MKDVKIMVIPNYKNELDPPQTSNGRFIEIKCPNYIMGGFGEKDCLEDMKQGNRTFSELYNATCKIRLCENGVIEGCRYNGKPEESRVHEDIIKTLKTHMEVFEKVPEDELGNIETTKNLIDYIEKHPSLDSELGYLAVNKAN